MQPYKSRSSPIHHRPAMYSATQLSLPRSPDSAPPCHQALQDASAQLRLDATRFERKVESVLLQLEGKRLQEIHARSEFVKTAEVDGENVERLQLLKAEADGLAAEAQELTDSLRTALELHTHFLRATADAIEQSQKEILGEEDPF